MKDESKAIAEFESAVEKISKHMDLYIENISKNIDSDDVDRLGGALAYATMGCVSMQMYIERLRHNLDNWARSLKDTMDIVKGKDVRS